MTLTPRSDNLSVNSLNAVISTADGSYETGKQSCNSYRVRVRDRKSDCPAVRKRGSEGGSLRHKRAGGSRDSRKYQEERGRSNLRKDGYKQSRGRGKHG